MKFIYAFFLSLIVGVAIGQTDIKFEIEGYENDTLIVGYYYGNRQLVQDTVFKAEGEYRLQKEEPLKSGMYLAIMKPANTFFQFLVPDDDQAFTVKSHKDKSDVFAAEGSAANEAFATYLNFIGGKNTEANNINEAKGNSITEEEATEKLKKMGEDVRGYQLNFIEKNPQSIVSKLIKINLDVEIPKFTGTEEEINNQRYAYYRKHYFDNIDFADDTYSRMPYTFNKIKSYMDKLVPRHPDSISHALDHIFLQMEKDSDFIKFYLSHFLNEYVKSKIVGMDGVYVHLVDNYYAKGYAPWVDEETLYKIKDNAAFLRPTLIGKMAQEIVTFDKDNNPVSLHGVDAEYTILYIYAYDCGHCKKSTPPLVEFAKNNVDMDIKVFTICSKREVDACWKYTVEKEMEGLINTVDPSNSSRFKQKYDVRQTPKVYILDREKTIVMKNFDINGLQEIMDEIIKMDQEKM